MKRYSKKAGKATRRSSYKKRKASHRKKVFTKKVQKALLRLDQKTKIDHEFQFGNVNSVAYYAAVGVGGHGLFYGTFDTTNQGANVPPYSQDVGWNINTCGTAAQPDFWQFLAQPVVR